MNRCLIIFLVLLCNSCVLKVHIVDAEIVKADDETLKIMVITDEDILSYDDSHWAYKVYLVYSVNENRFYGAIDEESDVDSAPFSAKRVSNNSSPSNFGRFETKWSIPLKRQRGISGCTYFYDLTENKTNLINIRISGGTMLGSRIVSNKYIVPYPGPK